tara:strand:+ start:370 stop:576 length:207 start_codon:yes stop_codon:yes gene_type:complete
MNEYCNEDVSEQELYDFCIDNIDDLFKGSLSIDKINLLNDISFDWGYYIVQYLKTFNHPYCELNKEIK